MKKSVSIIFQPKPQRWGLRGDPYLWNELEQVFATIPLPCSKKVFIEHFESYFENLTNHPFRRNRDDKIYVENYAHGGMSSGHISIEFWQTEGFPLLLNRLEKINGGE